jgi:hypothetical protein
MTIPNSDPADRFEQASTPTRDAPRPHDPDVPIEAPAPDAVEQATDAGPGEHLADEGGDAGRLPLEADPADAHEQAVVVELDEDEHR